MTSLLDWSLAFSPILVVLVLMVGLRWGGIKAGPAGWSMAMVVACWRFGAGWQVLAYSQAKGLLLSLFVLYIIWMALLLYRTVDEAGAVAVIGAGLPRLTADRALQALLLGWVFSAFLQGAGGFGVPVAIIAPLLVGLGFPTVASVVIPSLGHCWAVTFGSLGSSFYALMGATGRGGEELAPWSAVMLGFSCLTCGAAVLWAAGGPRALRQRFKSMLLIGVCMAVAQYLAATNRLWALGGLTGGLVGLAVSVGLASYESRRNEKRASDNAKPETRIPTSQPRTRDAQAAPCNSRPEIPNSKLQTRMPLSLALIPYAILIVVIVGGQLVEPIKAFLGKCVVEISFPELTTRRGWVTPAGPGRTINVFGHAGALLFYSSLLSYLLFRLTGHYRPGAVRRITHSTVKGAGRSSVGIIAMVGMAVAMEHAGMVRILAEGVAEVVGGAFPLATPYIGALGAFMTGSNTNSNVVFAPFQQDAASLLELNPLIILAGQTAGAAIGSMFAPAKVIVGASTVGLGGNEGPVLKKVMTYGLVLVGCTSLVTWTAITWLG